MKNSIILQICLKVGHSKKRFLKKNLQKIFKSLTEGINLPIKIPIDQAPSFQHACSDPGMGNYVDKVLD